MCIRVCVVIDFSVTARGWVMGELLGVVVAEMVVAVGVVVEVKVDMVIEPDCVRCGFY